MHKCPVNGCEKKLRSAMFMCSEHWWMVPGSIRTQIYDAMRTDPHSDSHQMACQAATEAVNESLGMEQKAESGKGKAE